MKIRLSDHFDTRRLLRFTLPSIAMLLFTSVYGVVDGFFVSNHVGKTAFAALNLTVPPLQVIGGIGAMLGVGGSALTAKTLGEGDRKRAGQYFTMMIKLMFLTSLVMTVLGVVFIRPIVRLFGATEATLPDCVSYGVICLCFGPAMHAQYTMQSYLVVAEKPKLGLWITLAAGFTNMVLDYVFMAVMHMGVGGAALATGLSQCVGGFIPLLWFLSRHNRSPLHFEKARLAWRPMLRACGNGASEMLSSVAASITGMLYNRQLMNYAGEDGVAAYGTAMYLGYVFVSVYVGYSSGVSPVVGYHYGAQNRAEMRNILRRSLILLAVIALLLIALTLPFARQLSSIFVGYDAALLEMTTHAFRICALPYLLMWLSLFTSSFFTALNDGAASAAVSFLRSLVFPTLCILVLPLFLQLEGIWYAMLVSETLSTVVSIAFLLGLRKKYGY